VAWAHFTGFSAHSPIFIAVSNDGGNGFVPPVKVSSARFAVNQDARIAVDPATGYAYVTFDNSVQGGKGTAMFVSVSTDHGVSWGKSVEGTISRRRIRPGASNGVPEMLSNRAEEQTGSNVANWTDLPQLTP